MSTVALPERTGFIASLVDMWAGVDNSQWTSMADCTKSSGGSSQGPLYDSCMQGHSVARANAAIVDPKGAEAYDDITSGNILKILNPFDANGPLDFSDPSQASSIPTWLVVGGVAVIGLIIFNTVRAK